MLSSKTWFLWAGRRLLFICKIESPEVRPTDDVDCIIELSSYHSYAELEERIRKLGFENDTSPRAPIDRWLWEGIKIDIMPTEESILKFNNKWYKSGLSDWMRVLPHEHVIARPVKELPERGAGKERVVKTLIPVTRESSSPVEESHD